MNKENKNFENVDSPQTCSCNENSDSPHSCTCDHSGHKNSDRPCSCKNENVDRPHLCCDTKNSDSPCCCESHDDCCDDNDDDCCCCCGDQKAAETDGLSKKQVKMLTRIIASGVLFVILLLIPDKFWSGMNFGVDGLGFGIKLALYAVDYLIIGYDILTKSAKKIGKGNFMDENFLMSVATIGAIVLGLMSDGDFNEAVAVMLFYQIGEFFQGYAVGKSRRNITQLMDIRPDYANVECNGRLEQVDPASLPVGSVIVVQPGEKIPIDGEVIEGNSSLDTSALTGESVPRNVQTGSEVVSGCVSMTGVLKIRTSKLFGDSTVSKILDLVENASSSKAKSEDFIRKFARIYTPAVCIAAIALFVCPSAFLAVSGHDPQIFTWLYRALTFLVISCPCALVISIPLSFFAAIGGSSKNGVLVKGSNYIEALSKAGVVMFDKTGTLTKGKFEVSSVCVENESVVNDALKIVTVHNENSTDLENVKAERVLLYLAASVECASSHPIAKSLIDAVGSVSRNIVSDITEISGKGVSAKVGGVLVEVGNAKLLADIKNSDSPQLASIKTREGKADKSGTVVYVAINSEYAGYIVVSDALKDTSVQAISNLHALGVEKCVMLTGDNQAVAEDVACRLKIDEYHAELLPENKVEWVEKTISASNSKKAVAFVGDGINDAPVLMRADVGIAMGAMGSDAAIEAADVVLMDDDPLKVSLSIRIARKSMRIVYENISLSLLVKASCLILGAIGIANMYMAIFADVGVMILAVLNAMRCLRAPRK